MGNLISLDEVSAVVLPAKVLVLLSKYAQATRKHTGLVVKISSMNVFKHVHNINKLTEHPEVRRLHRDLLVEVNKHLFAGTMQTNVQRQGNSDSNVTDYGEDFKEGGQAAYSYKIAQGKPKHDLDIESALSINI